METLQEQYDALRRSGLSHREAMDVIYESGDSRDGGDGGFLDAAKEFSQGLAVGATKAGTSLVGGTGWLLGKVPGLRGIGEGLESGAEYVESGVEDFFEPEGTAGKAGEFVGRLGGEVLSTVGTLGLGKLGLARFAPGALSTIRGVTGGSRAASALGAVAAESPLSLARAASWSEERGTGFGQELAMEVAGSALGGAFAGVTPTAARQGTKGRFSSVNLAGGQQPGIKTKGFLTGKEKISFGLFDENVPVRKLARVMGGVDAEQNLSGRLAQMYGARQAGVLSLNQQLKPWLLSNNVDIDEVGRAALIRREMAIRFPKDPKNATQRLSNISDVELRKQYNEIMGDKDLVKLTDDLQSFFRDDLARLRSAKIISQQEYDNIINSSKGQFSDYYTPMVGGEIDKILSGPSITTRTSRFGPRKGVYELEKDTIVDDALLNPVDVLAYQRLNTFDSVAKQRVGDSVVDFMTSGGTPSLPNVIRLIKPDHAKRIGADRVWKHVSDGVEYNFEILDADLFDSLKQTNKEAAGELLKIAQKVADLKRKSITLLPDFSVMAILRDWPLYASQRLVQRGAAGVAEALGGGAAGAAIGASTEGTDEERAQRAITLGLAGLGFGALARPTVELAKAGATISRAKSNFLANSSPASAQILGALGDNLGIDPKMWEEFVREGGLTAGVAFGQKDASKYVKALMGESDRNSILVGLGKAHDVLETIGMVAENAPRLAMYRAMRSGAAKNLPGSSVQEAIWSAQDVTLPFALRGNWKAVKSLSQITPFFNAQLQGWSKIGRMFRGDPRKNALAGGSQSLLAMGAAITAPTVALWNVNKDNPEYWDRPLWERNMFWLVPKPDGGFYRIPKPFELGYVFASLPERVLDKAAQKGVLESAAPEGMSTASELAETVRTLVSSPITGGLPIPAAAAPFLEQALNRDLFRWKPIVPEYLSTRPGERQTTKSTPVLAQGISNAIKETTGVGISPLRIEALIQSTGGTFGRRAMDIVDVTGAFSDSPTPASKMSPEERLASVTGLSRFNTMQYDVGNIESAAYQVLRNSKNVLDEFNRMKKANMDREALSRYQENYKDELRIAQAAGPILSEMNKIREIRNSILADQNISQDRLRNQLDQLSSIGRRLGSRAFVVVDRVSD